MRQGHRGATVWFTGLSGAGKSTLASALERHLFDLGSHALLLDGDQLRSGLNRDLGFSLADRSENVRRTGELAKLLTEQGLIVIAALISPLRADREQVKARFAPDDFVEVWCDAPLAVCEQRDVKGLYARARRGEIAEFTGISSPYEAPAAADFVVGEAGVNEAIDGLLALLAARGILPR